MRENRIKVFGRERENQLPSDARFESSLFNSVRLVPNATIISLRNLFIQRVYQAESIRWLLSSRSVRLYSKLSVPSWYFITLDLNKINSENICDGKLDLWRISKRFSCWRSKSFSTILKNFIENNETIRINFKSFLITTETLPHSKCEKGLV